MSSRDNDLKVIDLDWEDYWALKQKLGPSVSKREEVKFLIKNGCRIYKPNDCFFDTPFYMCLENEDIEILELMLEKGIFFEMTSNDERAFVMSITIEKKNTKMTQKILDGFIASDKSFMKTFGLSPLMIACLINDENKVEKLLRSGANVNDPALAESSLLCKPTDYSIGENYNRDWTGYTYLHAAIVLERINIIKILLRSGADVNRANAKGLTPLHLAIEMNKYNIVSLLLTQPDKEYTQPIKKRRICNSQGVDVSIINVNAIDSKGNTPLLLAVELKSRKIAKLLLKHNADVSIVNSEGSSALYVAIKMNQIPMVKTILKFCCKKNFSINSDESFEAIDRMINFHHTSGDSLLHAAVLNSSVDLVKWLLSHGADRNFQNKKGLSPLHLAAQQAHDGIVRLLLFYDYYCGEVEDEDTFFTNLPRDKSTGDLKVLADVNLVDYLDNTPLHNAAASFSNKFLFVEMLIESGADVAVSNFKNQTPLHLVARTSVVNDGVKMKLLNLMLNVDQSCKRYNNPTDDEGFSHFHAACMRDNPDTVEAFLRIGAHICSTIVSSSRDWPGYTPLHIAAKHNCVKVAQLLIKRGAHVDVDTASGRFFDKDLKDFVQIYGKTPLHIAVRHGCIDMIKLLLRCGADVQATDERGHNLIHELIMRNRYISYEAVDDSVHTFEEIINILLEYGCDINFRNKVGHTPLHIASTNADQNAVQLLLRNGADVNKSNNENITPPMIWKEMPSPESYRINEIVPEIFRSQIIKLKALDMYVNNQNELWYDQVYDNNPERCDIINEACLREIDAMKKVRIGFNELLDILKLTDEELAKRVSDSCFERFIRHKGFDEKFPKYKDLIRLQYKRCRNRWKCLKSAATALNSFTKLPQVCCLKIAHYLSNTDLKTLSMISDKESPSRLTSKEISERNERKRQKFNSTPFPYIFDIDIITLD